MNVSDLMDEWNGTANHPKCQEIQIYMFFVQMKCRGCQSAQCQRNSNWNTRGFVGKFVDNHIDIEFD